MTLTESMLLLMWLVTPGQPEENAFRCSCNCLLHFAEKCYVVFSAFSLSVRWLDVAESKRKTAECDTGARQRDEFIRCCLRERLSQGWGVEVWVGWDESNLRFRVRSVSLLIWIAHHSNLCSPRPEQELRQAQTTVEAFIFALLNLGLENTPVQL